MRRAGPPDLNTEMRASSSSYNFSLISYVLIMVGALGTRKGSGTPPAKGELEFHKAIIQTFWDAVELPDKMVFDGKAYTCLTSLVTARATPEEGVSATNLDDLAFVRETGFGEGCDVDSVSSEFSFN